MKLLSKYLLLSLLPMMLCQCSEGDEDDSTYPSVLTGLVEANTDADQLVTSIRTDEGTVLSISSQQIKASRPDTTYRCLCRYELTGAATARVYSIETVFSALARPKADFHHLPKEPVSVISTWQTDRYINMFFGYLTYGNDRHALAFCEEKTVTDEKGKTTVSVRLLHERPDTDTEAFTQKQYLSLPTYPYAATCDSVILIVPTADTDAEYHFALN